MKLKREFSRRETILLLVLAIILLVLVYWRFVYTPVQDLIASYDTSQIEDQIQIEQARAMQKRNMEEEVDENKAEHVGEVATYNNLKQEINELNNIVSTALTYNFTFEEPIADGTTVRRNINLTFTASSYEAAEEIISQLYACRYRVLIGDLNIVPVEDSKVIQTGPVSVSATLTFFETTYGADNLDGLMVQNSDGSVSSASDADTGNAVTSSSSEGQ